MLLRHFINGTSTQSAHGVADGRLVSGAQIPKEDKPHLLRRAPPSLDLGVRVTVEEFMHVRQLDQACLAAIQLLKHLKIPVHVHVHTNAQSKQRSYTVKPLLKDTPEIRPPCKFTPDSGYFTSSPRCIQSLEWGSIVYQTRHI